MKWNHYMLVAGQMIALFKLKMHIAKWTFWKLFWLSISTDHFRTKIVHSWLPVAINIMLWSYSLNPSTEEYSKLLRHVPILPLYIPSFQSFANVLQVEGHIHVAIDVIY